MKTSFLVAMSVVLSTTAFAQDQSATTSTTRPAQGVGAGATTASTSAAAPEATSAAKLTKPATERALKGEIYNKSLMQQGDLDKGENNVSTENYVGLSNAIGGGQKVGIRQVFLYDIVEGANQNNAHMGNTYIYHTVADIKKFNEDLGLSTSTRLYLPTGEDARFVTKQLGSVRNYLNLVQKLGRFNVSANLLSQWYANSQDSYDTFKTDAATGKVTVSTKANKEFYVVPYAEVGYDITEAWSVTAGGGTENLYYRQGQSEHFLNAWVYTSWQAFKQLSLTLAYESDPNIGSNMTQDAALLRPEESYMYMVLSATL